MLMRVVCGAKWQPFGTKSLVLLYFNSFCSSSYSVLSGVVPLAEMARFT